MLEDYVLLIQLVLLFTILYGVSSFIGDKIAARDRRIRLEQKLSKLRSSYNGKDIS